MADVELIIKIPEEVYEEIKNGADIEIHYGENIVVKDEWASERIRNGTPLPKGHGRLKDVDAGLKNCINTCEIEYWDKEVPTIIEADKVERR